MDVRKWRVRRDERYARPWVVFAPGHALKAEAVCATFADAVAALGLVAEGWWTAKSLPIERMHHGRSW